MDRYKLKIAVYAILTRDEKVLLVLRTNTGWMNGYYGLPSGHLEENETILDATIREAKEETGVDLKKDTMRHVHTMHRQSRYIDLHFVAEWDGEPVNNEPDKHGEVSWHDINNLPENIIPSVKIVLEEYKKGNTFSELAPDYEK